MLSPLATVVYNHFEEITDPRLNRGLNHDFGEMMFLDLSAMHRGIDGKTLRGSHDVRHGQSPLRREVVSQTVQAFPASRGVLFLGGACHSSGCCDGVLW